MQHKAGATAGARLLHEVDETVGESGGATDLVGARWNVTCRAQNGATGTAEMLQHCFPLIRSNFARWLAVKCKKTELREIPMIGQIGI